MMIIYLHKDFQEAKDDDILLSFEQPEDPDNWYKLTTKDEHYKEIVSDLEYLIDKFLHDNDVKSADIAKSLCAKLRGQIPHSLVN